ncbi:hypothetical protein LBBP_00642 [Leptospira borgpetersenii serovar Ballum]|uniref:Uncharacterized protein n=1 Tax=Leptospira borgpetersenii serovar Ballum TaxID=280505 RepID=A0A0S2IMW3_LEPBO|nr:hypothetical protein LBBP_00642 [Leptospira borgpetersenii serovar Ballum]
MLYDSIMRPCIRKSEKTNGAKKCEIQERIQTLSDGID